MKILFLYLVLINFYGIISMYMDKSHSIKKQWRTPEAKLFLIAILFGSLGIWIGMYLFRHKTKHLKFVIFIPIILIVQIYLILNFILPFIIKNS